jgi:hypothetical protein
MADKMSRPTRISQEDRRNERKDCPKYRECWNEAALRNLAAVPCHDCKEIK